MIYKAGLAADILGKASELVISFIRNRQNPDGGFKGRSDTSDIYYTMFGFDCLTALKSTPIFPIEQFLAEHGSIENLDFVHLCSLTNLLSAIFPNDTGAKSIEDLEFDANEFGRIANQIEKYRAADGGYNVVKGLSRSSIYGNFLAISTLEEIGAQLPDGNIIVNSIMKLKSADGGFANEPDLKEGTTTATAAAIVLLDKFGVKSYSENINWLLKMFHPSGGFLASPSAPIPDLLSTATALHCLSETGLDMNLIKEKCLDYLDSLWSAEGAFYGTWADETTDVEYTFYGLLALGSLH
jgi:hypothetical protein